MKKMLTERDILPGWPTVKEMAAEIERDLRRIAREEGCERIATIEARQRKADGHVTLSIGAPRVADNRPKEPMKQPRADKPPAPIKVEKPKKPTKPDGWITIGEWCEKWKLKPMEARAALRGSGMTKPDFGWAFDPKEEKKIKKICGVKT